MRNTLSEIDLKTVIPRARTIEALSIYRQKLGMRPVEVIGVKCRSRVVIRADERGNPLERIRRRTSAVAVFSVCVNLIASLLEVPVRQVLIVGDAAIGDAVANVSGIDNTIRGNTILQTKGKLIDSRDLKVSIVRCDCLAQAGQGA